MTRFHRKKVDVACFLPNTHAGGAERVTIMLMNEFVLRGYAVDLILGRMEGALLAEIGPEIRVFDLNASRFRRSIRPLAQYIGKEGPAALMAVMWPGTGVAVISKLISGSSRRLVLVEHSTLSRSAAMRGMSDAIHRRIGRHVYARADGVVAVSEGVKEDLVNRTGLRREQVTVIYNPVRLPKAGTFSDADVVGRWRSGEAAVVAIGSLKDAKDYPTLLRAFARLRQSRDARLLILGEGGLRADLEALVASLGLQDSVLMPGFVPDPYPYLAQADLFVLSSAWEGLPGVLIEALVAGVPVVSTDCPSGPAEILEGGRYGRLVPVGDPAALAAAMTEALDAPHDRDLLRRRGNEFSVERAADQYLALLDPGGRILAGR